MRVKWMSLCLILRIGCWALPAAQTSPATPDISAMYCSGIVNIGRRASRHLPYLRRGILR